MTKIPNLKRTRYWTMNSWNGMSSLAYNLKVHRLGLPSEIVNKLYDLIGLDGFYDDINELIHNFEKETGFQAGFNGRSGGYLVLYRGDGSCRGLEVNEVPVEVRRAFRKLALDIVRQAIYQAIHGKAETVYYTQEKQVFGWAEA